MSDFQQPIDEKIKMLRTFVLVHSYLYYKANKPFIPDSFFDQKAKELAEVQQNYPEVSAQVEFYREAFADWTGESGFQLPQDEWVRQTAYTWMARARLFKAAALE